MESVLSNTVRNNTVINTTTSVLFADPTAGVELANTEDISPLATRYVFLAADLLDPTRREQLPHLSRGGEETANFCLRRSEHRFLPRCAITPLEYWGEDLPLSLFPKEGPDVRSPLRLQDAPTQNVNGRTTLSEPRFFYPHYPGELIRDITQFGSLDRNGTVELTALKGEDWGSGRAQELQTIFFPESWELPVELTAVEARIHEVVESHTDPVVRQLAKDMLDGCELSRRYMQRRVDGENTLVAQRVSSVPGSTWVYRYSATAYSFMAQLGQKPRNNSVEAVNAELAKAFANAQVPAQLDENAVAKLGEVFGAALREALKSVAADSAKE